MFNFKKIKKYCIAALAGVIMSGSALAITPTKFSLSISNDTKKLFRPIETLVVHIKANTKLDMHPSDSDSGRWISEDAKCYNNVNCVGWKLTLNTKQDSSSWSSLHISQSNPFTLPFKAYIKVTTEDGTAITEWKPLQTYFDPAVSNGMRCTRDRNLNSGFECVPELV